MTVLYFCYMRGKPPLTHSKHCYDISIFLNRYNNCVSLMFNYICIYEAYISYTCSALRIATSIAPEHQKLTKIKKEYAVLTSLYNLSKQQNLPNRPTGFQTYSPQDIVQSRNPAIYKRRYNLNIRKPNR